MKKKRRPWFIGGHYTTAGEDQRLRLLTPNSSSVKCSTVFMTTLPSSPHLTSPWPFPTSMSYFPPSPCQQICQLPATILLHFSVPDYYSHLHTSRLFCIQSHCLGAYKILGACINRVVLDCRQWPIILIRWCMQNATWANVGDMCTVHACIDLVPIFREFLHACSHSLGDSAFFVHQPCANIGQNAFTHAMSFMSLRCIRFYRHAMIWNFRQHCSIWAHD
jgi:hypothetical protein